MSALEEQVAGQVRWQAQRAALLHERAEYEARGLSDRVALVDAELGRLGPSPSEDVASEADVARVLSQLEAAEERAGLVASLVREREGYVQRQTAAARCGDEAGERRWQYRIGEVDSELRRIGGHAAPPATCV